MASGRLPGKFSPRSDDVSRLVPATAEPGAKLVSKSVDGANALSSFHSEDAPFRPSPTRTKTKTKNPASVAAATPPAGRTSRLLLITLVAGIGLAIALSAAAFRSQGATEPKVAPTVDVSPGQVTLETLPVGVEVVVDGQARGLTPLSLPLNPGRHEVILRRGSDERRIPLDIASGAQITQRIEFAPLPAPSSRLLIVTEPAGARVTIDGERRGVSPVTVANLPVGRHRISVTGAGGTSERIVTTEAGTTTSVVFSLLKAPSFEAGWLTITSPFEVRITERGEVIGTSATSRIMIPAGSHDFEFSNETLGYTNRRRVAIETGKSAVVSVDAKAPLNVNARPWAEVTIDGSPVGVTPIANHVLSLGSHQVLFSHPELGQLRQEVLVTLQGPNRLSVDMTTK